jgi:bifunctional UDP-N-acetylglucosamine pyrophosphorylase/glucosamine-1-phosphate N-acetyltransferase
MLRPENFSGVIARLDAGMDAAVLGFEPEDTLEYGRLITDGERLLAIREHKDATDAERQIRLCNACILAFRADVFRALIDKLEPNNAQGQYYVTDLVELANKAGHKVGFAVAPERDVMGVNDRSQLANAEAQFQQLRREDFMKAGVTLRDPATVYFSYDTEIARDVVIEPNVWFGPGVKIGEGSKIFAFSHLEHVTMGPAVTVGPFARIRGGTVLEADVHLGNFVEVKKSHIGKGTKAGHLAYLGDAEIGARVNIGAGTITANYDGVNKSTTTIGDGAFIGTHSSLVAPVTVGEGAYTATGSTITKDVEPGALAIARSRQENKPGYAAKIRARAEAIKKSKRGA